MPVFVLGLSLSLDGCPCPYNLCQTEDRVTNDIEGAAAAPERTVVLVDDDRPFLSRLSRAMESRGFDVRSAETVADGLALEFEGSGVPLTDCRVLVDGSDCVRDGSLAVEPTETGTYTLQALRGAGAALRVTADDADLEELEGSIESRLAAATWDEGGERWRDGGYALIPLLLLVALFWLRPGWVVRYE